MSFAERETENERTDAANSLERRTAALVNPASGLANDFLNVYNEILMLIEMLPDMPDLFDDIAAWRPASYRGYFIQSQLPGRFAALEAYDALDPAFRALFDASVEQLAAVCVQGVTRIEAARSAGAARGPLAEECARASGHIRTRLDGLAQLVTFGRHNQGADMQAIVTTIFSAA